MTSRVLRSASLCSTTLATATSTPVLPMRWGAGSTVPPSPEAYPEELHRLLEQFVSYVSPSFEELTLCLQTAAQHYAGHWRRMQVALPRQFTSLTQEEGQYRVWDPRLQVAERCLLKGPQTCDVRRFHKGGGRPTALLGALVHRLGCVFVGQTQPDALRDHGIAAGWLCFKHHHTECRSLAPQVARLQGDRAARFAVHRKLPHVQASGLARGLPAQPGRHEPVVGVRIADQQLGCIYFFLAGCRQRLCRSRTTPSPHRQQQTRLHDPMATQRS